MGPDSGAQGSGVQQRPEQKTFLLAPGQEGAAGTSLGSCGLRLHASGSGGLGWGGSLAGKRRSCMPQGAAKKRKRQDRSFLQELAAQRGRDKAPLCPQLL